jgi:hypothetical protein
VRRRQYPLEALAEVRQRAVDVAMGRLSFAVKAKDAATKARQSAEQLRLDHERAAAHVRDAERDALERGDLRAADLAREATWGLRIATERARLSRGVDRTKSAEAEASEGQRTAQVGVASRRADADVVAKDRARWDAARKKSTEARDEEAAAEGWRPKR